MNIGDQVQTKMHGKGIVADFETVNIARRDLPQQIRSTGRIGIVLDDCKLACIEQGKPAYFWRSDLTTD